jgi:hypothetical protein
METWWLGCGQLLLCLQVLAEVPLAVSTSLFLALCSQRFCRQALLFLSLGGLAVPSLRFLALLGGFLTLLGARLFLGGGGGGGRLSVLGCRRLPAATRAG